jgi:hypothetical protein
MLTEIPANFVPGEPAGVAADGDAPDDAAGAEAA